jgi:hypothetical protein
MQAAKTNTTENWTTVISKKDKKDKNKIRKCHINDCVGKCDCFEKLACYKCEGRLRCKCDMRN